jgi:hypothetical protein
LQSLARPTIQVVRESKINSCPASFPSVMVRVTLAGMRLQAETEIIGVGDLMHKI